MNVPGVTRGRRTFFAPVWIAALFAIAVTALAWNAWRSVTTTSVFVLRHAEKQLGTIADPPLTDEGEQRALRLAIMFASPNGSTGRVTAIYASDTRRAQQTAAPLAQRLGLTVLTYPVGDIEGLARSIRHDCKGGVVVVIGHSNTVPKIVAALGAGLWSESSLAQPETDFGSIFAVNLPTWAPATLVRLRY